MSRIHNFSAGPAVLPEPAVKWLQSSLWELGDTGLGLVETSHRAAAFDEIIVRARERIARLLGVSQDDYAVLFLHGGARTQFFQIPMNLLRGARATYLDTGRWSAGAITEAKRFGNVDVPWSSQADGYIRVPAQGDWGLLPKGTRYLHYTSNNTVAGTEYSYVPEVRDDVWLVCDMSSDFFAAPIDGNQFALIYAGAQKNLGPSGTTLVVIRRDLLDYCDPDLPTMLRYGIHVEKESLYNTPCTFAIAGIERVCAWIEDQGGLSAIEARNIAQANRLYEVLDASDYWRGLVERGSRSRMNVTFTSGDAELDTRFWKEAAQEGMSGLKGHRSVGGLRASLYNAQTDAAVEALVGFMSAFAEANPQG